MVSSKWEDPILQWPQRGNINFKLKTGIKRHSCSLNVKCVCVCSGNFLFPKIHTLTILDAGKNDIHFFVFLQLNILPASYYCIFLLNYLFKFLLICITVTAGSNVSANMGEWIYCFLNSILVKYLQNVHIAFFKCIPIQK